ncbi:MAG: copper homeostasis protein CutE [Halanaerobium sp.]
MEFYLIILTAVLFSLPAYLPVLFFLSWAAFIPLIYLTNNEDYKHSFVIAFLVGLISSILKFYWIYHPIEEQLKTPFAFIFLIIFIYFILSGLPLAVWVVVNKFLQPKNSFSPIIAALSWSSLEFLRFKFINLNPFNYLAYNQTEFNSLIQFASWGGIFLVSFLAVLIAGYFVKIYFKPSLKRSIPLIIIFILILSIPYLFNNTAVESYQKVELLNINPALEGDIFTDTRKNTESAAELIEKSKTNYIFTPENFLYFDLIRNNYYRNKLFSEIEDEIEGKFIQLGSRAGYEENYEAKKENSIFLLDDDLEIIERYDQNNNLLTLNNIIMHSKVISLVEEYLVSDIIAEKKEDFKQININQLNYINLLSVEILKPIKFDNSDKNINMIINSADDSNIKSKLFNNYTWSASVLRAAENKVSVLRTAKEGYSGYITPKGREEIKIFNNKGIITAEVELNSNSSYYQKDSEFTAYILLIITFVILTIKTSILIYGKYSKN